MVEISDSLHCVFTATVRNRGGDHVIEVPSTEITQGEVTPGESYRVAVIEASDSTKNEVSKHSTDSQPSRQENFSGPPVEEGEVRDVTVESVGDKGDGIAKVESGYVIIVPGSHPGEQPTVKIDQVKQNVAFASVVDSDPRLL